MSTCRSVVSDTRPGKRLPKTMENHHLEWENSLFLWPCSIAMLNYQRVYWVPALKADGLPSQTHPATSSQSDERNLISTENLEF